MPFTSDPAQGCPLSKICICYMCQATFNLQVPWNLNLMSLWVQFISTINCSSVIIRTKALQAFGVRWKTFQNRLNSCNSSSSSSSSCFMLFPCELTCHKAWKLLPIFHVFHNTQVHLSNLIMWQHGTVFVIGTGSFCTTAKQQQIALEGGHKPILQVAVVFANHGNVTWEM